MTDYSSYYNATGSVPQSFWDEFSAKLNDPSVPAYSSTGAPLNTAASTLIQQTASQGLITINPVTWTPVTTTPANNPTIYPTPQQTEDNDKSPMTEDDPDDQDEDLLEAFSASLDQLEALLNGGANNKTIDEKASSGWNLFENIFGQGFSLDNLFSGDFFKGDLFSGDLFGDDFFKNLNLDLGFEGILPGLAQGTGSLLFGPDIGNILGDLVSLPSNIFETSQDVIKAGDSGTWENLVPGMGAYSFFSKLF